MLLRKIYTSNPSKSYISVLYDYNVLTIISVSFLPT